MISLSLLLLILPLVFSVITGFLSGKNARASAMAGALINLVVAGYAFTQFEANTSYQFAFLSDWIPSIGAKFHIGIDGINLLLILLTNLLLPVIIYTVKHEDSNRSGLYYCLILFMQFALLGVFMALDALLYYIFWELALIPIYLILLGFSSQPDFKTFVKFFIYTLAGSLFMFIAILYVYIKAPGGNFSIDNFYNNHLSEQEQIWVFLGFFIAYAIKIPIIPFHTWQPDTYTKASTPGTMLLSGVMLKMGTFSLLRWLLPVAPLALATVTPVVIILCIIGIVYGSIIAIRQKNIKTLFAYSSLAHVGLISAGVFALNADGFNGALIQMFNHGIIIVGLFLIAEIIYTRTETYHISELGGIRNEAPTLAFTFLIIILASVALPLTNGFVGEFLLLNGVFQYNQWMAVVGGTTVILSATYMLRMYQRTMLGLDRDYTKTILDLSYVEKIMVLGLVLIIIVTGIWPSILLDPIKPAVENLLNIIKIVQ